MFKFTSEGLIEFGSPIELTDDDRAELYTDICEKTAYPTIQKKNGRWIQQSSMDMMDWGYRIHEEEEPTDTLTLLKEALTVDEVLAVQLHV